MPLLTPPGPFPPDPPILILGGYVSCVYQVQLASACFLSGTTPLLQNFCAELSLCAASRMWVMHQSVVIVSLEGDCEFRWDSEMCWCFIHVTIKLFSGTTQRSVMESCSHTFPPPHEKQFGACGKRRGFSPAAATRPLDQTRAREDSVKRGPFK